LNAPASQRQATKSGLQPRSEPAGFQPVTGSAFNSQLGFGLIVQLQSDVMKRVAQCGTKWHSWEGFQCQLALVDADNTRAQVTDIPDLVSMEFACVRHLAPLNRDGKAHPSAREVTPNAAWFNFSFRRRRWVRSAGSEFRPRQISCRPFSHSLMQSSSAVDSPSGHGTNRTRWQDLTEAPLGPARSSQREAQDGSHRLEGQGRYGTVATGVAVLPLQNGSRWQ
jgi:hypothetical protein